MNKNYLNLGCGALFHPEWTNVDVAPSHPSVIQHDLSQGIPFDDETFDATYHSHVLEHMTENDAIAFTRECWRVLRPGGVLRVVVPDLEDIARTYLRALDYARAGDHNWRDNYRWILLELLDQMARHESGGEMLRYLLKPDIPNKSFLLDRMGPQANGFFEKAQADACQEPTPNPGRRIKLARMLGRIMNWPKTLRRSLVSRLLTPAEQQALDVGAFRNMGEVHLWMYDEYALGELLKDTGFEQITRCTAEQSMIDRWHEAGLDNDQDGSVKKPASLFMEAVKPRQAQELRMAA